MKKLLISAFAFLLMISTNIFSKENNKAISNYQDLNSKPKNTIDYIQKLQEINQHEAETREQLEEHKKEVNQKLKEYTQEIETKLKEYRETKHNLQKKYKKQITKKLPALENEEEYKKLINVDVKELVSNFNKTLDVQELIPLAQYLIDWIKLLSNPNINIVKQGIQDFKGNISDFYWVINNYQSILPKEASEKISEAARLFIITTGHGNSGKNLPTLQMINLFRSL